MAESIEHSAPAVRDPTFVGRASELLRFESVLERMLAERRQVLAVVGEPGIGKTRCAEAFAQAAEERGALAIWGRCYEEPGAPPYWPWVQILREYVGTSSPDEVHLMVGPRAQDLATFLPEIAGESDPVDLLAEHGAGATLARFRAFETVARLFAKAAAQVPLVLVIDNLHWADKPSLSLLEFLTNELERSRVLFLITYRDTEVSRKSPLVNTLGGLARGTDFARVRLGGLSGEAVAELARTTLDLELPPAALEAILEQTDGTPLFVIELLKVLVEEASAAGLEPISVRIPDGVREAIGRRLSRLPDRCNELLAAASVLGRGFSAHELAAAAAAPIDELLPYLELAATAGILDADPEAQGAYRFAHALIRETLYDEIPKLERLKLHGRAGDALAAIHAHRVEPALSRIAHHYFEAAPIGYCDKAAESASRAAKHAARMLAFEEAIAHLDQIVSVLELHGRNDDDRIGKALLQKGYTLINVGEITRATTTFLDAAHRLRSLGNWSLLADVVVHLVVATSYAPQRAQTPLLRKVLDMLPEENAAQRAKALAALAFTLRNTDEADQIDALVDRAVTIARDAGDPDARSTTLKVAGFALRGTPLTLNRRLELDRELIELSERGPFLDMVPFAYGWHILNLLEAGRIAELEVALQRYRMQGFKLFGLHECLIVTCEVALALLRGEWDGLEERIEGLLELGSKVRPADAEGVYAAQMFSLNRDRGRLNAFEPIVREFSRPGGRRPWTPALMVICAELGMLDEARDALERFTQNAFADLPRDDMLETSAVFCAEACWRLADAERARAVYALLAPYEGLTANHPRAVCFGAADLYLGMMAATYGDLALATRHYEAAIRLNRAMEAWPWLARTQLRYGASLMAGTHHDDHVLARQLIRDAEQLAGRLGMAAVASEARGFLHGRDDERTAFPDDLTPREVDVLRLIAIGRSNKDISVALSISLSTVATHVRNILTKTECANRTEAAAYALRNGLQRNG